MRLTRRSTLALGGAAAASLAAPAIAQAQPTTVGALRFTSHAASFVALERGYFADEGLDVSFEFFQAAQPMAVAIASRDADYAVTAISGGLINLAAKGAARVIGGALSEEPGIDGQLILASNDSGVDAPAGLDGKRWGMTTAGSSFHYVGSKMAQAEGIDLEYVPLQKVPALIGALKSSQIDGWEIVPHIAKPLVASGAARMIGRVSDYLPDYQVTTVFTSAENAANDRARTEAFLRAFSRGASDFNAALVDKTASEEEQEAMVRLIHGYVYTDRELEAAAPAIIDGAMRVNEGAALNMASVEDQMEWFRSEGLIDASIETATLVDDSYVETIS